MKKHVALFTGSVCLILGIFGCAQAEYDLAIKDVDLYDGKNKTVLENRTVLINADTIAAILGRSESFQSLETIDGQGRLLTPGFIDTHTHLMQNYTSMGHAAPETIEEDDYDLVRGLMAEMYLRHGVTTIIDMGQPETWIDVTLNWQKSPTPDYPNLFICGGSIVSDANYRQPQHHIEVKNPEEARQKVRDYAEKGLKHMKLYRKLKKPDFEAMADEAKNFDITINTHTDNNVVTIDEAMKMGVQNFEHFFTVSPSIMNYDHHWKAMNEKYGIQMSSSIDEFSAHMTFFFSYIKENTELEMKLMELFDRMAANGASISTALNVLASAAGRTEFFTSFEYFPIRRLPMVSYSAEQRKHLNDAFDYMMLYVKKAHDKGVKIRVGTDCRYGGKAMLHELLLLNEAGISMKDILQIATVNGYESMNLDDAYGSIQVGKKADLLLFDKSPFENAKNLFSKKTVIKGGKLFSLKKSIAYELQETVIDQGIAKGLEWFETSKNTSHFEPLNPDELKHVICTFAGDGRVEEAKGILGVFKENFPNNPITIDGDIITNGTYARLNQKEFDNAIAFYEFGQNNFPKAKKTLALALLIKLLQEGTQQAKNHFKSLKKDSTYILSEDEMNTIGYTLLRLDKPQEALTFFRLNADSFPNSWNVYDSLGEAYMSLGQNKRAIKSYRKAVTLNPENNYGKEQLKKLGTPWSK